MPLDFAVPEMQADDFRYGAVLAEGGFYADADARCLGPLAPLLEPGHRGVLFRRDNGNVVNGCFGFRAPGRPCSRRRSRSPRAASSSACSRACGPRPGRASSPSCTC